jgi:hypothetical protein
MKVEKIDNLASGNLHIIQRHKNHDTIAGASIGLNVTFSTIISQWRGRAFHQSKERACILYGMSAHCIIKVDIHVESLFQVVCDRLGFLQECDLGGVRGEEYGAAVQAVIQKVGCEHVVTRVAGRISQAEGGPMVP